MKGVKFQVTGNWAHFKKPETNNNPLSHDFITKTALLGIIGAVLGIERKPMKEVFPLLSDNFKYGVCINNAVQKQSWGFTLRSLTEIIDKDTKRPSKAPKQMEFIKNPDYEIIVGLVERPDKEAEKLFDEYVGALKNDKAHYTPVLGLHNCPAELYFLSEGHLEFEQKGNFKTKGFVSSKHQPEISDLMDLRLGFEKIPTYQNNDFWNLPEKYMQVVYPSEGKSISVFGEHYSYEHDNETKWYLI
jgi:CRISPR-associated protein Cas5 subtype I-B